MLWEFQVDREESWPYTYMYPFSLKPLSHPGCYLTLSSMCYVIGFCWFKYSSVYMTCPKSLTLPSTPAPAPVSFPSLWVSFCFVNSLVFFLFRVNTCCCCLVTSVVSDPATLWTATCQAPLFMGLSRQEHWSGLPRPSPGDLPSPGIEPVSCIAGRFFTAEPPGGPPCCCQWPYFILFNGWVIFQCVCVCVRACARVPTTPSLSIPLSMDI